MFLDVLRRRNPEFHRSCRQKLHHEGKIPANAYVIDLDADRAPTPASSRTEAHAARPEDPSP